MNKILLLGLVAGLIWYGNYSSKQPVDAEPVYRSQKQELTSFDAGIDQNKCDGRTHCSQMTSCAEATFFIRSCPDTEMDGDGDGVPCERQWCN